MISPRPEILTVPTAHHGALDYAELERLGLDPETVLDFSVNSNPYGPSPAVREALQSVPLDRYPDSFAFKAKYYAGAPEWINVGDSAVVNPDGQFIAGSLHKEQGILYAEIDPR